MLWQLHDNQQANTRYHSYKTFPRKIISLEISKANSQKHYTFRFLENQNGAYPRKGRSLFLAPRVVGFGNKDGLKLKTWFPYLSFLVSLISETVL